MSTNSPLIQKLTENGLLTGDERLFLAKLVTNTNRSVNENVIVHEANENYSPSRKKMRNVKVQVHPGRLIPLPSVETQTDVVREPSRETPNGHTHTKRKHDTMYESKRLASNEKIDSDAAKELMDKLYNERRSFILTSLPVVSFVKEKYPLLFSLNEVRHEIERIFNHGICEVFIKNIGKFAQSVMSMTKKDDPIYMLTNTKIRSYETVAQKKYALEVGSVLMLSSLMNEDRKFIKLMDLPLDEEDALLPYIEVEATLAEMFFDEHLFKIYVEKNLLCIASDFKEAILCLVGSYYIFNIEYPRANWNTLSAFERLYLEKWDSDTEKVSASALQIIRCLHHKVQASRAKSK